MGRCPDSAHTPLRWREIPQADQIHTKNNEKRKSLGFLFFFFLPVFNFLEHAICAQATHFIHPYLKWVNASKPSPFRAIAGEAKHPSTQPREMQRHSHLLCTIPRALREMPTSTVTARDRSCPGSCPWWGRGTRKEEPRMPSERSSGWTLGR